LDDCWRKEKNDGIKNGLKNDWNSMAINSNDGKAVNKGNQRRGKQGERKSTGKLKIF